MVKDTKKIIMFALPNLSGGGAERVFLNLINNINIDIFEVHVVLGNFQGEYFEKLSQKVFLHELGYEGSISSIIPLLILIWKIRPEIIISTLGYVVTASISSLLSPKETVFISRFGNTISSFLKDIKNNSRTQYFFQYLANRAVISLSNGIIVQSNHMADDLQKTFNLKNKDVEKIFKINNPVEFISITHSAKNSSIENKVLARFDNSNYLFVSVGGLRQQKNYMDLIRAFSIVNKNYPNSRLIIIGEGGQRTILENEIEKLDISDFVFLLGFVSNPESIVSNADFYISSSIFEGVSNAILESLALGIPVIATDCPSGIKEVITDSENGYLVSLEGDIVRNLSEKMSYVVKNNIKKDPIKISKKIKEEFDISIISSQLEDMLISFLKKRK